MNNSDWHVMWGLLRDLTHALRQGQVWISLDLHFNAFAIVWHPDKEHVIRVYVDARDVVYRSALSVDQIAHNMVEQYREIIHTETKDRLP